MKTTAMKKPAAAETERALATLSRGAEEILPEGALRALLAEGRPLRVKAGFDPTAPDIHLGHCVLLHKMRQFQELGHTAIFLIGDFTARIGDPSGRDATRPPLSEEAIRANAETYARQALKILDPERTELRRNSEWHDKLGADGVLRLAGGRTVARTLERDDFKKRMDSQTDIGLHELLYPLMQGYDSVALRADVELGGTDQKFNLMVGRDIQKQHGMARQCVLTLPLLEGLDGVRKMSKSLGNHIGVDEPAAEIYGKAMRISDGLMVRYCELVSSLGNDEIAAMKREMEGGANPMGFKRRLAFELAERFCGRGRRSGRRRILRVGFRGGRRRRRCGSFGWRRTRRVFAAAVCFASGVGLGGEFVGGAAPDFTGRGARGRGGLQGRGAQMEGGGDRRAANRPTALRARGGLRGADGLNPTKSAPEIHGFADPSPARKIRRARRAPQ